MFRFQQKVQSLKPDEFVCDIHIPELLVFAAGTDLHEHELCSSGSILLQDKVSLCVFLTYEKCIPYIVMYDAVRYAKLHSILMP